MAITSLPEQVHLTLYLLCHFPQKPMGFAPHGWKTLLPLRLLGVPHAIEYVTLAELRQVLPARFGTAKVTLPTLVVIKTGCSDEHIMDSYRIAQYLETHYSGPGKSLYAAEPANPPLSSVGRQFGKFIEQWVDRSLAHAIRPCVLHSCYATFPEKGQQADIPSREAFLAKCGQDKLNELITLNNDPKWTTNQYAAVRRELGTIEVMLQQRRDDGEDGAFLGGIKPMHADFCVFAFYAYSRANSTLTRATWHADELPCVRRWIQAFLSSGLVSEAELPALSEA